MPYLLLKPLVAGALLATATPALAVEPLPGLVESSCISVIDDDGCLFERNANEHNANSIAQVYNAARDPDISLNILFDSSNPWPGTITPGDESNTFGTWSLPGYLVQFVAVKADGYFRLYQLAAPASSGSWSTLNIPFSTAPHALSHLDFYTSAAIPEPASWAMLITGFGFVGGLARRRRPAAA